jgi:hypothetical protein
MKKYSVSINEAVEWEWNNIEAEDAQAAIDYAKKNWDEAKKVSTVIDDEDYLVKRQERSWDDGILQLEL